MDTSRHDVRNEQVPGHHGQDSEKEDIEETRDHLKPKYDEKPQRYSSWYGFKYVQTATIYSIRHSAIISDKGEDHEEARQQNHCKYCMIL